MCFAVFPCYGEHTGRRDEETQGKQEVDDVDDSIPLQMVNLQCCISYSRSLEP